MRRGRNKYLIEGGNPKLLKFPVKDGKEFSLTLEYHFGYNRATGTSCRKREKLSLRLVANPRTPMQRQQNKDTIELARKIRWEREQEFLENREGYRLRRETRIYFFDFFDNYIENYSKKDIRMIKIARDRFRDFLNEYYPMKPDIFMPDAITHEMMKKFAEYLQTRSVGEGAKSILQRFKKVVRNCMEKGYIKKDPCKGVTCICDEQGLRKEILSCDEIQRLMDTHYPGENGKVRDAFLFCLYTGMRFCDVKDLSYSSIDYSNKLLRFDQDKTKGHSSKSWVTIPLTDGLLKLVGQPPEGIGRDALVFNLPTYESCCKSMRRWIKRAGIDKHISWHCARHSFAVNILVNGSNIKTVQTMLGHSSLRYTERYLHVVDKQKEDAINSLPELKL